MTSKHLFPWGFIGFPFKMKFFFLIWNDFLKDSNRFCSFQLNIHSLQALSYACIMLHIITKKEMVFKNLKLIN